MSYMIWFLPNFQTHLLPQSRYFPVTRVLFWFLECSKLVLRLGSSHLWLLPMPSPPPHQECSLPRCHFLNIASSGILSLTLPLSTPPRHFLYLFSVLFSLLNLTVYLLIFCLLCWATRSKKAEILSVLFTKVYPLSLWQCFSHDGL